MEIIPPDQPFSRRWRRCRNGVEALLLLEEWISQLISLSPRGVPRRGIFLNQRRLQWREKTDENLALTQTINWSVFCPGIDFVDGNVPNLAVADWLHDTTLNDLDGWRCSCQTGSRKTIGTRSLRHRRDWGRSMWRRSLWRPVRITPLGED